VIALSAICSVLTAPLEILEIPAGVKFISVIVLPAILSPVTAPSASSSVVTKGASVAGLKMVDEKIEATEMITATTATIMLFSIFSPPKLGISTVPLLGAQHNDRG
jgi:hypothetical protein